MTSQPNPTMQSIQTIQQSLQSLQSLPIKELQYHNESIASKQGKGKKKKEVLLKHLSVSEKQKLANLILTIHQLTEQKLFYESKYANILPKLKQMMEKFEERSRRLSQYQNAMKKLKSELDNWKETSTKLKDQVHIVESERDEWRTRFEDLDTKWRHHLESQRSAECRGVQVETVDVKSIALQTEEISTSTADRQMDTIHNPPIYSQKYLQTNNQDQNYTFSPSNSTSHVQSLTPQTRAQNTQNTLNSPLRFGFIGMDQQALQNGKSDHNEKNVENLSEIFDSDSESIYSLRQREVDALLQRSEAVLNRSRASRPSTPDELLETRRRRQELLHLSSGLHKLSNLTQEHSTTLLQQARKRPEPYSQEEFHQAQNSQHILLPTPNTMQNNNQLPILKNIQYSIQQNATSQRQDANDLFRFVDILEQNLDFSIDHRNQGIHQSNNPLTESHVSITSNQDDQNTSFATSVSHLPQNVSEAWFDMTDTFQENDIFDIIS